MPIPPGAVRRGEVGGVPLFYERRSLSDPFGDLAPDEAFQPYFTPSFWQALDFCLQALWRVFGVVPRGIITAGVWVDKPGEHGDAEAFDLDAIVWPDGFIWRATEYALPEHRRIYLGIQAHLMKSFGIVLAWDYNTSHRDHMHIDSSRSIGFRTNSRMVVTFIQASCRHIFDKDVEVDGLWGPRTRVAMASVVGFPGLYPAPQQYAAFMDRVIDTTIRGFMIGRLPPLIPATPHITLQASTERLERAIEELRKVHADLRALG